MNEQPTPEPNTARRDFFRGAAVTLCALPLLQIPDPRSKAVASGLSQAEEAGSPPPLAPVLDSVTPEMFGWTASSTPAQTAVIINAAIRHARTKGLKFVDNGKRTIKGTITLGGPLTMEFGANHAWTFDYSDLVRDYTQIMESKRGDAGYSGSGRYVAVDTSGAGSSSIRGRMTLIAAPITKMDVETRALIPGRLVAFSAATKNANEITIEALSIFGFGYGIFQGDFRGQGRSILGQTRLNVRFLFFRHCLVPMESGLAGNGLDDMFIEVLRISRCGGTMLIRATDLNAGSIFNYGLNPDRDNEPGTIALKAGSNRATLSQPHRRLKVGDVIAVKHGNLNKDRTNQIPFVSRVAAVSGTGVTFDDAPDQSLSGQNFLINPPSMRILNGSLTSMHHYVEGTHDVPVHLDTNARFASNDFKASDGEIGCRRNTPILATGMSAAVRITLNTRTMNDEFKALIGFARVHWPTDPKGPSNSGIVGDITATGDYARQTVKSDVFACVPAPQDLVPSSRAADRASGAPSINVVAHFADGDRRFSGCGAG
jgi:hypothetical protein